MKITNLCIQEARRTLKAQDRNLFKKKPMCFECMNIQAYSCKCFIHIVCAENQYQTNLFLPPKTYCPVSSFLI